ncbi:hypothetical protein CALVIDRAFT_540536 [Calocera viscosa TUFC12733]|uniref:Uncharacterized protein n=1 Tax=Calocera viscosa (strain TUFC12733) TaxID=1330018 RepID=A0A167IQQ7_CALVF|nr:hypothetical protein CALVIDRAFT_540536 [Calocera viscosa TUFC12733]
MNILAVLPIFDGGCSGPTRSHRACFHGGNDFRAHGHARRIESNCLLYRTRPSYGLGNGENVWT